MDGIRPTEAGFEVDASLIAAAFRLDAAEVPGLMRAGQITSRCETGINEDTGRWRLTFFHKSRVLRLTVDVEGSVLLRATFDGPKRTLQIAPEPQVASSERVAARF